MGGHKINDLKEKRKKSRVEGRVIIHLVWVIQNIYNTLCHLFEIFQFVLCGGLKYTLKLKQSSLFFSFFFRFFIIFLINAVTSAISASFN